MSVGLSVLLGLLAIAAGAVNLLDRRIRHGGRLRNYESARWATRRDLRSLRVKGPEKGRVILGRRGRTLIAAEPQRSVIVFGPTRISRKTTGLAIPALKEWQGPAIATSVKSDLLLATIQGREARGEVTVFDPTATTDRGNARLSPLAECGSWEGALRTAHRLCGSGRTSAGGLEDSSFWYAAAERLLSPLLFAAARDDREMADVMTWIGKGLDAQGTVAKILVSAGCDAAIEAWEANCGREERQRSSIYTTAETILATFADPRVLAATANPTYAVEELLDGGEGTLYLFAPRSEQKRLGVLFASLIAEVIAVVDERFAATGQPLDPPLLLLLDEAANLAPIPDLAAIAATVAGEGVQLVTIYQDLAQVRGMYGREADSIVNNHVAKLFGAGLSDPSAIDLVRQLTGKAEVAQRSETRGQRHSTATEGGSYLDIAPPVTIRQQQPGDATMVYGHLPPALLRLGTRDMANLLRPAAAHKHAWCRALCRPPAI